MMTRGLQTLIPVSKLEELMSKKPQLKKKAHTLKKVRMALFKKYSNQKNLKLFVKRTR
jgi:hypothetical protein